MIKRLDFFLFLGSTCTYLSVNRAERLASRRDYFAMASVQCPQADARTEQPSFRRQTGQARLMWRDVQTRVERFGIPFGSNSLGIFGLPTFAYGTEIFWGD